LKTHCEQERFCWWMELKPQGKVSC